MNSLFVLLFEENTVKTRHTRYLLPKVEIKDYNVMNDGRNVFGQPTRNNIKTHENISIITTGQGNNYTTVVVY